jgi:thymidine kinase
MNGIRVVGAGLDKDYLNRDFGPMGKLKKMANTHIQLAARCHICNGPAHFTYRTIDSEDLVLVGHNDLYQARCETHWNQGMDGRV